MTVRSFFKKASQLGDPVFRYGMLLVLLGLLAADVHWDLNPSPASDPERYMNAAVVFMLLLNHLAFAFKWPFYVTISLRIVAVVSMLCVAVYLFCLLLAHRGWV